MPLFRLTGSMASFIPSVRADIVYAFPDLFRGQMPGLSTRRWAINRAKWIGESVSEALVGAKPLGAETYRLMPGMQGITVNWHYVTIALVPLVWASVFVLNALS